MKTIYRVSCDDMNLDHGTYENKSLAQNVCNQVNAFNPELGRMGFAVGLTEIQVFEPGDPIFTHVALYSVVNDTYSVHAIAPTMFEHWNGLPWMLECIVEKKNQGAFGRAGISAEHALSRLKAQIAILSRQGFLADHRTQLLARGQYGAK
jgi:hypothetical protein